MNKAYEVNFDGLIGPSHNYGGMSDGNIASTRNQGLISSPKQAALEGLEKMRFMVRSGLKQGFLPPLMRPNLQFLQRAGFGGDRETIIREAARHAPHLLKAAYSASPMWAANAATVSPSADTEDGKLHLTPANLLTMLHRSLEHSDTYELLRRIFPASAHFEVHSALPDHAAFSDEGAANHVRLCAAHGQQGVELFVYGRERDEDTSGFPARQSRLASECVARSHKLASARTVFARQSRTAIDSGAFHNDVVCVGTLDTLFTHELAFEDRDQTYSDLRRAATDLFDLRIVEVPQSEVPLEDAIRSYLFNSQLVQMPGEDRLVLIAPTETQETPSTRAYCERMVAGNGPIGRVQFVDVRQSMRNGGGPACLRLRVVMTEAQLQACHPAYLLTDEKIDALANWVERHYRNSLLPVDLGDPALASEIVIAQDSLTRLINRFNSGF